MTKLQTSIKTLFTDKQILILGFGKEGFSTFNTLRHIFPDKKLFVMDIAETLQLNEVHDNQTQYILGKENYLKNLVDFDVIFKTPSIPHIQPEFTEFVKNGGLITSQLNEFLRIYKDQVIGVTGTKGKSTTTTFIYQLLINAEKVALLAGNIGIPPFEIEDEIKTETLIALEMSSYQLDVVQFSPHIAIWLNVYSEHLNYHSSIDLYSEAKSKITSFQNESDVFIYNNEDTAINKYVPRTHAKTIPFSLLHSYSEAEAKLGSTLNTELSDIFLTQDLPAVLQLAEVLKISSEILIKTVNSFQSLPHRLEKITTKSGVVFIDDTLATIPEAAVAAIHSFKHVKVILLGGFDRGIDYSLIVDEVVKSKIEIVIFFKPSGEKMKQILEKTYSTDEQPRNFLVENMEEAVKISYEFAKLGDVVLLSPASPSFGQFHDYEDKAAQFRHWISELDHE